VPSGATVVETGPGWGVATTTTVRSARVVAIDVPSRRLDLELADGRQIGLRAGPEVRRLAEIRAGDVVNVAFVEALALQLAKKGGTVSRTEDSGERRSPSGALPGGISQSETVIVADVVAVDAVAGTVTLRGPKQSLTLRIRDSRQLALVRPGDQVQATYTEAVAVSIDPAR
jgi:hypothetical protein